MAHVAKQIRDRVVTTVTGLTTTETRVFPGRVYPVDSLPCLVVFTSSDDLDDANTVNARQYRDLTVTVEGRTKVTTSLENDLDAIRAEVETALMGDAELNGTDATPLGRWIELASAEYELSDGADKPVGVVTMNWRIRYRILGTAPETVLA